MLIMTAQDLLNLRHHGKRQRVALAQTALNEVFGKNRVGVHAGSNQFGEDTTHWLYISLRFRKKDERNQKKNAEIRREVIKILKDSSVPLETTSYSLGQKDEYAINLYVERYGSDLIDIL